MLTTANPMRNRHTGRITALKYSSYSYWFRYYGLNWGNVFDGIGFMELYWFTFRNFAGFKGFISLPVLVDWYESQIESGLVDMNKRTKAVDKETYKRIIAVMKEGFSYAGVDFKPNLRISIVLIIEYNLGLRVGDVLNLTVDSFVKDGNRYRLDIYEQKTGKYRNFTVPDEVYQFIRDYAYEHNISPKARLFPITERAVLKHLKVVCEYLGLDGIGTHSFRKAYATNAYVNSNHDIELVRILLQHSSVTVTQRYIGIGSKELEDAIQKNICLG